MPTPEIVTLKRPRTYRLVWLAEVEPVLTHAPDLSALLRPAFDKAYAKGATAFKVAESASIASALATVRA
jgi:hypothetical protein